MRVKLVLVSVALFCGALLCGGQGAQAAQTGQASFANLAERLSPAVVNISTTSFEKPSAQEIPGIPKGSPLDDLFKDFLDKQGGGKPQKVQSLGSGFVIDAKGIIVTNNHVIEGADKIEVTFTDGTTLPATLQGADDKTDIAVLKVKPQKPLVVAPLGDSNKARVGDWVMAIGNPFGLGGSVSAGIISALNRDIHSGNYDDFIQTDAAINRGNSGGPLFNTHGEVIGVNSAIISPSGESVGIGFAVPTSTVMPIVTQLIKYGEARRGWIGVRIQSVSPDIAETLGLDKARGALVAGVSEKGPAALAGVTIGDVFVEFNGQPIREMRDLSRIVAETEVGSTVPALVQRDGKLVTLKLKVAKLDVVETAAKQDDEDVATPDESKATILLGIGLIAINDAIRAEFELGADARGVLVVSVDENSAAAAKGVLAGDIIVAMAQKPVSTPDEMAALLKLEKKSGRNSVLLKIMTGDDTHFVALPLDTK